MKRLLIIAMLALGGSAAYAQSLREQLLRRDSTLTDVELTQCRFDSTVFIAVLVTTPDWWEALSIVKYEAGRIVWTAEFDTLPSSQSIRSVEEVSLPGRSNAYIEVFDQTHMGNGFYYLYDLQGRQARLIASAYAVDRNRDGTYKRGSNDQCDGCYSRIIKDDQLVRTFDDVNGDRLPDIKLTGTVQIVDEAGKVLEEFSARKVLLYRKEERRFVEDVKLRRGFTQEDL